MLRKGLLYTGIMAALLPVALSSAAPGDKGASKRQAKLQALAEKFDQQGKADKAQAAAAANRLGIPLRRELCQEARARSCSLGI